MNLIEIYSNKELYDKQELLSQYIDNDILDFDFSLNMLNHDDLSLLLSVDNLTTVIGQYREFANRDQKSYVNSIINNFDEKEVIVICDNLLIDGYHRCVAAIELKKSLFCIDLNEHNLSLSNSM